MLVNVASIAIALLVFGSVASAAPGNSGQIVQIKSGSNWCMMMPPEEGGDIALNEDRAIAFCTNDDSDAPGAKIFPSGFIHSAHFATGNGYVQVTGQIDRTRYSLAEADLGGQYDIKAPVGSACAGYNHYVNLIEPHMNTYCIRCCKEKVDCNTGKSTYGCALIVPGDYSGPSGSDPLPTGSIPATGSTSVSTASTATSATTSGAVTTGNLTSITVTATPLTTTITGSTTTAPTPTQTTNAAIAQGHSSGLFGAAAVAIAAILAF
ncbi:hypothetical protein BC939DRAFT_471393 [Gamsiella multidivaricata]|uniref:uncharacterized protein n=1 Tax=Gamsiella multidivaricata TaxID=101098 RepID=UPI00221F2C4F|nr:uncharacterized protein BC939DRAFT_471393 [Gamsiella multidivaricata]KAG0358107.1 hypothetical protein BGZ54_010580 [Gamsiella multidivaricata]KAI7815822.1 hypothetical protein BC939DRAFT_471393 [Gamsiella multidivaricata]